MPSPFPGMDPYLESPDLWPDVHHELMGQFRAALNPLMKPNYVARVELRVYISDDDDPGREVLIPDLRVETTDRGGPRRNGASALKIAEPIIVRMLMDREIKERYLAIKEPKTNRIVTIIELMSPTNKIRGAEGRKSFMSKKNDVLASDVNWVEIDLLRSGAPSVTNPPLQPADYRVLVSRADNRSRGRYWPISIRQELPVIGIPLRGDDADVPLDLGACFTAGYDVAAYEASIDYSKPPVPPLAAEDARWANKLLRAKGLR